MSYQICAKCDRCGAPTYWRDGWAGSAPQPVTYICKCYDAPSTPMNIAPSSLRDWFAAKAMQGILSAGTDPTVDPSAEDAEKVSKWAYQFADALLAQRTGGGG